MNSQDTDGEPAGGDHPAGTPIDDPNDEEVLVDRPDDEDHDLLTFGEAGARLEEEVIKLTRTIGRLREGGADDSVIDPAMRRLQALEAARDRNRPPTIDDLKSSGFFGPR